MYTLRKVSSKGEMNIALGNSYFLLDKEHNLEEFGKTTINIFPHKEAHSQKVSGYVVTEGGKQVLPFYKDEGNYIMTETGKTFACLK